MLRKNLLEVLHKIDKAKENSTFNNSPQLIAVSKTKPVSAITEAYEAGIRDFGENKVQELIEKYDQLPKDIRWHMIGHLQRNKVKYIVDKVYLIHSVDSLRLAEEISKEACKKSVVVSILIEINIAKEDSKFGLTDYRTILNLIKEVALLPNIQIKGLMTVPPYTENSEENRPYFANLRQLAVDIMQENIDNINMDILSMGMTGDYEVAIEEGASYVRVGTGIFGERNYGHVEGE